MSWHLYSVYIINSTLVNIANHNTHFKYCRFVHVEGVFHIKWTQLSEIYILFFFWINYFFQNMSYYMF